MLLKNSAFFILSLAWVSSCSPVGTSQHISKGSTSFSSVDQAPHSTAPLKICSQLDLAHITWPLQIKSNSSSVYFALALNITGSFEGHEGWKNIANNSDGQGLSLGLMQQNLGQGTLQPLLIQMFKTDQLTLKNQFASSDFLSLKKMLEDWQNTAITVSQASASGQTLFPDVYSLNKLDEPDPNSFSTFATNQTASVQWAVSNLYSNNQFIARWKNSFQQMATTAAYRTLQVEASTNMFTKAESYFDFFQFKQLRSLLFLFDLVVQNGGFTTSHLNSYKVWLSKNPNATESDRLLSLLDIRLASVSSTYYEDVKSRKLSIINGTGTVHGRVRNYPKEFCYDSAFSF